MAREETAREDLLREATALTERAELIVAGFAQPIVAGFRTSGALSLFFGDDPVYQFNSKGELRRAFRHGQLIKAENRQLFELQRTRTGGQLVLAKSQLDAAATNQFLGELIGNLTLLLAELSAQRVTIVGQVPPDGNIIPRLSSTLAAIVAATDIAAAPNAI